MTEHFLSYEQSLAVKELGFDKPCLQTSWDFDITNKVNIPLPLKGQFFKWVREKRGLAHNIHPITYECYLVHPSQVDYIYEIGEYTSYEQAEDACINKIIELLKNK